MDPFSPPNSSCDGCSGRNQGHNNSGQRNEPVPSANLAQLRADASVVIRKLPLSKALRKGAKLDTPYAEGQSSTDHPDAAAVVEECRRRQPDCACFSDAAFAEAYVGLLQDRLCGTRVLERYASENPEIARAALAEIAEVFPNTNPGERLLIWYEVRRLHAKHADHRNKLTEIRNAWRNIQKSQRRVECLGKGKRFSCDKQVRQPPTPLLDATCKWTDEPLERMSAEEIIQLLNQVLGARDRRYLWQLVKDWGHWSDSLLAVLQSQLTAEGSRPWMDGREMTKQERSKCHAAIIQTLGRLLARQSHPILRQLPRPPERAKQDPAG